MSVLKKLVDRARRNFGPDIQTMTKFGSADPIGPEVRAENEFERFFFSSSGRKLHKWTHYLPIYETYFRPWRGSQVRMLEIGVQNGGSLEMWRSYFGSDAIICGIDINPECSKFDGESAMVRIGSQADHKFLADVVREMGGVDIVLDDGSHRSDHMRASFEALFPLLADGGVYLVEDCHACYWTDHHGGYSWPWSFLTYSRSLVDDMHHWYHRRGSRSGQIGKDLEYVHFYDSVVAFKKRVGFRPKHMNGGSNAMVKHS